MPRLTMAGQGVGDASPQNRFFAVASSPALRSAAGQVPRLRTLLPGQLAHGFTSRAGANTVISERLSGARPRHHNPPADRSVANLTGVAPHDYRSVRSQTLAGPSSG